MKMFKLVKPNEAKGRTKELYEDIIKTWGKGRLVPVWGFFGNDPVVLEAFWNILKHYKVEKTETPKKYFFAVSLNAAIKSGCERCVNTHERELIKNENLSEEFVDKIKNYEKHYKEGTLEKEFYLAIKLGEIVAFGGEISDEMWEDLTKVFSQKQLFEIIIMAFIETIYSRYGATMAVFDDSIDWPREYTPSRKYQNVITK